MRRRTQATLLFIPMAFVLLAVFNLSLTRDAFDQSAADDDDHHHHHVVQDHHPIRHTSSITNHHNLAAIHELTVNPTSRPSSLPSNSVLFPDWDVLLLLPPHASSPSSSSSGKDHRRCVFHNGRSTAARFIGTIHSSARAAFICSMPPSIRRLRPFYTPRLDNDNDVTPPTTMLRLNRLVYESVSTPTDVILFAKGINNRAGVNRPASDIRCVFLSATAMLTTAATSSAQEVFRCPHPGYPLNETITTTTVSLLVGNETEPVPSLAAYRPAPPEASREVERRSNICACTMVLNVAKFLKEWVVYHSGIGVERFVLYDNGSEDELEMVVDKLNADGFNVSTRFWPWPKTQEAGFSHCAAVERDACNWMAYLDVDEFAFSPGWSGTSAPDHSMLSFLLPNGDRSGAQVGQVSLRCRDFGPSGQRKHPAAGVTQGYTCRRRAEERHKSLVLLDAVDHSLVNSVHHFGMGPGWRTRRTSAAVVNHYKYQAWTEFKAKFRRRVSAYVADWTAPVNMGSKDRTPGLGAEAVEPRGWDQRFCEVRDTQLRDTVRRWFGVPRRPGARLKLVWEED